MRGYQDCQGHPCCCLEIPWNTHYAAAECQQRSSWGCCNYRPSLIHYDVTVCKAPAPPHLTTARDADARNISSQVSSFDVAPTVEMMKMPNSSPLAAVYQSSGADSSIQVPAGYDSRTIENAANAEDASPHSDIRSSLRSSPLGRPMVTMEAAMNDVEFGSVDSGLSGLSPLHPDSPAAVANAELFASDVAGRTPDSLAAEAAAQAQAAWAATTPECVCSPVANTASAGSSESCPEGPSLSPAFMTPTGSTPSFFRNSSGRIDEFSWVPSQEGSTTCSQSADDGLQSGLVSGFAATELAESIPEDTTVAEDRAPQPSADVQPQDKHEDADAWAGAPLAERDADAGGDVQPASGSSGDLTDCIADATEETMCAKSAGGDVAGDSSMDYADTSGLDVSMSPYMDAEASKTSSDVSGSCVSLMCPQIFTESGRLDPAKDSPQPPRWPPVAPRAGSPLQPQIEATSLSLAENPPMHGDITDSDELGSGLMGTAAGHTTPFMRQDSGRMGGSGEGTGMFVPPDGLNLSPSSHDGVFVPGRGSAGLSDSGREGRGVRFRMDGDMGLKSCVKVLFLASQEARSTIGEEMSQVLVDHGVVTTLDIEHAC